MADQATQALRTPPHSIEAEQAVLGGLMLDNRAWDLVSDQLTEQDFYRRDHRLIFKAIGELTEQQQPSDAVTLSDWLTQQEQLDDAGGLAYLGRLAKDTPSAANIQAYANIVREHAVLRQLIEVGTDIVDSAFRPGGQTSQILLDEAERKVFEIAEQGASHRQGYRPIKTLLSATLEHLENLMEQEDPITGLPTGYTDFDEKTSGLQKGDLVIIAGRPSMGKTAFAMNIAEYGTLKAKQPVAVFSMEMPGEQLAMRLLSSLARVDQHRLRTGQLGEEDWIRLGSAVAMLNDSPLFIDDSGALTPSDLRSRARRIAREQDGLGLIIVDYLQLMRLPQAAESRANEISEISRSLKALAKELQAPVIALSQLNRSLEQRPDKRPKMSDLRECVTGDTPVLLADGRRVPVATLEGQAPVVLSMNADGCIEPAESDWIWSVGKRPTIKVSLASGRSLCCTADHRLRGLWGWKVAGDLLPGDRLAVFRQAEHETQEAYTLSGETLQTIADSDLFWDRVVRVEPAGDAEVFDMTVPGNACWLADGIVSHNSGAIEQDADVIAFVYRDEVYNEDSDDKGTAEVIIAKQRNGPIGTVRLTFQGQYTRFDNFIPEVYSSEGLH